MMSSGNVREKEPKIISNQRKEYYRLFKELPLPSPKEEAWKYTDIKDIELEGLGIGQQEIVFSELPLQLSERGVVFCNINTALLRYPEIIAKHIPMKLVGSDIDKLSAMHGALWNDGIFIYIPENVKISVSLRNIFKVRGEGAVLNHSIIILEENSSLIYVEEHSSESGDYQCLRNDVTEIYVKDNSKIDFYNLQSWKHNVINFSLWKTLLGESSCINCRFAQFGGRLSRIKADTYLTGNGAESKTLGMFYEDSRQHFDITTNVFHCAQNTTNNVLVKGVLDGESVSVYRGMIKIDKSAQKTNSYLTNHSLMLSRDAISNSIPSLMIDANDVRAFHAATLGKPDEEEIFYLMSRGLTRTQAERLIIQGYFAPITDNIQVAGIKQTIEDNIIQKVR
jgi:Fe-S cluster assembly protein SufD